MAPPGYKGPKSFNRAFLELTRLTPSQFRLLPSVDAGRVIDNVQMALYGSTVGNRARPRRKEERRI